MAVFNQTAFAKIYSGRVSKNYLKIEKLIEKGKYHEALAEIIKILNNNPDDLNAKAYIGSVYSAQFKLDAAKREYQKMLEKDPNNAAAHNGLGMVYYRRTTSSDMKVRKQIPQLLNKALKEFSKAIENAPLFYQAYNNAGEIFYEQGRIPEAKTYFRKSMELKPDYSKAVENYGKVLFSENQINDAIKKYKESIKLNTRNSSAYYHLGEALIAKGQYSDAIKYLQTSLYLFPNSAPVHNMLGKAYELQKNEAAAIAEYKKASLIKPEYPSPYLSLANIYENRGDEELAISELRNAISVNPNFYEARARIAEISLNIGRIDQTIKCYKELLNVPQYKKPALNGLSRAYFMKAQQISSSSGYISSDDDFVRVKNALKQAINYDPDNLEFYLDLLKISKIAQEDDQSKMYLNHIIKKSGDNRIDHIIKGEAYLAFKDFNNTEKEFIQAINQTRSTEDLLKLAKIFIIDRTYSSAEIALNRVLALEPNNLKATRSKERIKRYKAQSLSKMRVAEDFYKEKQRIAAIEAYKDSIALNPYMPQAHLEIAKTFDKEHYYYDALEQYKAYVELVDISYDTEKYKSKIKKLQRKIKKINKRNKPIKRFSGI